MSGRAPAAPRIDLPALGMGVAFALMWSSAFTAARFIVTHAPALTALSLRFLCAGLVGLALAWAAGQSWRLAPAQWRATLIFGVCQNALYLGLNFFAMQKIEASLAAIVASTLPLLVAAVLWAEGERPGALGLAGLGAGFGGALLILAARLGGGTDPLGVLLVGLAAVAITVATLAVRGATGGPGGGGNVLMVVALQMLVGAAVLAPVALLLEGVPAPGAVDWSPALLGAFLYAALLPGLLATWVWFRLVRRIGPTRAAAFHFLNPVFGVAVAALVLGEGLGPWDVAGVAIVTAGILAVQLARIRS